MRCVTFPSSRLHSLASRLGSPLVAILLLAVLVAPSAAEAQRRSADDQEAEEGEAGSAKEPKDEILNSGTLAGLEFRSLGPALVSGRVVDLAIHPSDRTVIYAAVASGGVWKTENAGITWQPTFDSQKSYSVGALAIDPNDPKVIWAGTGENNSQRSVSYGDGVYKSVDGGANWDNVGLAESEHIGMIKVDPRDSRVVWVAAQGPLWSSGGDRGLYKTTDGGESWERKLEIDEHTGVSEVWLDPRNPDVMYAVAYQRGRRVWTLINGGPGSGIHKSTDGGESWRKLSQGLPKEDLGRIGIAVSPADGDIVYAIVEARSERARGVYRSEDAGATWSKKSGYVSGSPQYYQELIPDPHDPDRVYSMDTFLMVTEDGGANWSRLGQEEKHVDEHALWIDPANTDHLWSGNDGGIYESFDRGQNWRFVGNLPITQFYKIAVDDDEPFYSVYGGTQDNQTIGCPTRTTHSYGITNEDCYITVGGDGFQPRIDPDNPDIVYSQSQHGNLVRYDRRTGERVDIKPREDEGEEPLRWNWDSPLIISPHEGARLYFAAQRVFRSEDRGNSWTPISPDLTRGLDRDQLEIMGKVWPIDAVAKHTSTSVYGNLTTLSESPRVEGLLYAGADDGMIQVLEPGATEWRAIDEIDGVPQLSYASYLVASPHSDDTVFAVFNNHKQGDFKPYLLRSDDRGQNWTSIVGDLPERGSVWVIQQDPVDPTLLFAGTEFGVFTSLDGGQRWLELGSGLPTIAVRDIAIQEREVDLVLGTFGRGFYILDDYSALRNLDRDRLEKSEAILFPTRDALAFIETDPLGDALGATHYRAENPPFGATFTYYLKESSETLAERRKKAEKEAAKAGEDPPFPTLEELRLEQRERDPKIVALISDDEGNVVQRISGPAKKGTHRLTWDLRHPPATPVSLGGGGRERGGFRFRPQGPLAVPGTYTVDLYLEKDEQRTAIAEPQSFEVVPLGRASLPVADPATLAAFQHQVADLQRAVMGASRAAGEAEEQLRYLRQAVAATPAAGPEFLSRIGQLEDRLADLQLEMDGDSLRRSRNLPTPPSISSRVNTVVRGLWRSTAGATATQERDYGLAADAFDEYLPRLRQLIETDLESLQDDLEAIGAPWTPGRLPKWQRN